ncbi:hypothetical protein K1719_006208 [Acacia pycnantha]|nr:hypothetical protein K1719_006208 [Acacia pycnantha]
MCFSFCIHRRLYRESYVHGKKGSSEVEKVVLEGSDGIEEGEIAENSKTGPWKVVQRLRRQRRDRPMNEEVKTSSMYDVLNTREERGQGDISAEKKQGLDSVEDVGQYYGDNMEDNGGDKNSLVSVDADQFQIEGSMDVCEGREELFPDSMVKVGVRVSSDHHPLIINTCPEFDMRREKHFLFEEAWLKHSDFRNFLLKKWVRGEDVCGNIKVLKEQLGVWSKEVFGHIRYIIRGLYMRLEGIQRCADRFSNRFLMNLEKELEEELVNVFK